MPREIENNVSGSQTTTPSFRRPQVSPLAPLEIDGDRADNWKLGNNAGKTTAILEHSIGIQAMRLYNGMKFSKGEDRNRMADILAKYDQHFLDQTQEFFERFQFSRRDQASGESIDEYLSVLRNMSRTCGFCDCIRDLLMMDCLLLGDMTCVEEWKLHLYT